MLLLQWRQHNKPVLLIHQDSNFNKTKCTVSKCTHFITIKNVSVYVWMHQRMHKSSLSFKFWLEFLLSRVVSLLYCLLSMGCSSLWDAVHYWMQSTIGCSSLWGAFHYGMHSTMGCKRTQSSHLLPIGHSNNYYWKKQASNNNNNNRVRRHRLKEFLCKLFSNLNSIR